MSLNRLENYRLENVLNSLLDITFLKKAKSLLKNLDKTKQKENHLIENIIERRLPLDVNII